MPDLAVCKWSEPLVTNLKRSAEGDIVHARLRQEIEKPEQSYLWTPAHTISFVPRVLPVIYGDGRALFALATINQRPAYWVIRGCSSWGCGLDWKRAPGPDFAEFTDEILTDLEEAFGNGRCGYSGASLFLDQEDRGCDCEECLEEDLAQWPMVDGCGGCSWSRIDWPPCFATIQHPLSRMGRLLAMPPHRAGPSGFAPSIGVRSGRFARRPRSRPQGASDGCL